MKTDTAEKSGAKGKYAWRELDRVEPPKRPVRARLSDFNEVSQPYDETTASQQASRCVQCPNPNCVAACPLEIPIPELLGLTADGQFRQAAELLFNTQSLPEFIAHICVEKRMCEAACVLQKPSNPVPIGSISRFLLDYGWKHGVEEPPSAPANGRRVIVIGSGLCGLVAADALSRLGYAVTIMDSSHAPGGRLINGLAGFKVDRAVVRRRVQSLKHRGVQFRMGVLCGRDVTMRELRANHDALLFALGPHGSGAVGYSRREVAWCLPSLSFHYPPHLRRGPSRAAGQRGGPPRRRPRRGRYGDGCVADRPSRRSQRCLVHLPPGPGDSCPADPKEFDNAVEEGARFLFRSQPVEILGNLSEEVTRVRCVRTQLDPPDASGGSVRGPGLGPSLKFRRKWCWWPMASRRRTCRIATSSGSWLWTNTAAWSWIPPK